MKSASRRGLGEQVPRFPSLNIRIPKEEFGLLIGFWLLPVLLAVGTLTLYLSTLSDVHTFDALTYLRDIEHRSDFFLHPHHLLYGPTGWLFWQSWNLFGYTGMSELPLKVLSALLATGSGLGLYHLTLRLTRSVISALIAAGVFFFSYANWYFAVEVEVYMLSLVWQLVVLALLVELLTAPRRRTAPLIGLALAMAALFHQTNGLLVPLIVVGVMLAPLNWRDKLRALIIAGFISGGIVGLAYGIVGVGIKGANTAEEFRRWMLLYVQSGIWGQPKRSRWLDLGSGLGNTISTRGAFPYWIGIVVILVLGWSALRRWPKIVMLCVSWIVVFGGFFIWWEPDNIEFWISTLLPLWLPVGLATASVKPVWRSGAVRATAIVGLGLLAWQNYWIIERRGDATYDVQRRISAGIREASVPSDLIIEPSGMLELYLPHYEARPNLIMIHRIFWQNDLKLGPTLVALSHEVETALQAGVAVLVGRDAMDRADIPPQDLDAFWQPYRSVMEPAVTIDGTVYFWRIPSAPDLIERGGWQWTSFSWGWQGANIDGSEFDDGWCFNPNVDPALSSPPLTIRADSVRTVEVTMSTTAPNQTAQLFYRQRDDQLSEEHSLSWQMQGDGLFHTYTLPVGQAPGWDGTLTLLRLDPIAAGSGTSDDRTCITSLQFK